MQISAAAVLLQQKPSDSDSNWQQLKATVEQRSLHRQAPTHSNHQHLWHLCSGHLQHTYMEDTQCQPQFTGSCSRLQHGMSRCTCIKSFLDRYQLPVCLAHTLDCTKQVGRSHCGGCGSRCCANHSMQRSMACCPACPYVPGLEHMQTSLTPPGLLVTTRPSLGTGTCRTSTAPAHSITQHSTQ